MASHESRDPIKKPCVKFEERRLNTLREKRARPDITNLITGFFLRKNPGLFLYMCLSEIFVKAYTCLEILLNSDTSYPAMDH